jgi:hypothetical protein
VQDHANQAERGSGDDEYGEHHRDPGDDRHGVLPPQPRSFATEPA